MVSTHLKAFLGVALALACGCQSVKGPSPEETATLAARVSEPLAFRTEALPDDEAGSTPDLLTLPEAVRLALRNDPGIQAALGRVRIAQAEAQQSRLLPNPILSVGLRYPDSGGSPIIEAGLTQEFLSILQKPGLISATDDRLRASGAEAVSAVLDVLAEVQKQYSSVQTLDKILEELEKRKTLVERLLELTRARLEAGEGTRLDVTTVDAQRLEIEAEFANRELERREERLVLSRLIGHPSGEANWRVSPWEPPPPLRNSETEWIKAALEHRPEIQSKHWELSALGVEQRLAWFAPFEGLEAGVESERDAEWSVGPSISTSIPIFDFGQARRERAKAAVLEARHELVRIKRQVIEEVRRAHAAYLATEGNLAKVRAELIPLAEQRLEQAQVLYQAGETDSTELFLAEQDLHEAHTRQIELEQKGTLSLIALERAVGGPGVAHALRLSPPYDIAPSTPTH
jgi:cobalt-zinc-cadmium efflux system outer membrane protein